MMRAPTSSASSVVERRDKQVFDALDNGNWKQALQLLEKRLKKGEKGDSLLALRAHVLLSSPSSPLREQGAAELRKLCERDPPVTDISTLIMLQENCAKSEGGGAAAVSGLWERAIKSRPHDEVLPQEWFQRSFDQFNWKNAQKAAMILQKSFPKKRHYYFWAILTSHLVSISDEATEAEKKLFGTLGYRMITKAASDVPKDPKAVLSPGRAIQTPEELRLLVSIYRRQGALKELADIMASSELGSGSAVAKGDWAFVREHIQILEDLVKWTEEWELCKKLLDLVRGDVSDTDLYGDDWRVWEGLLLSCEKLDDSNIRKETEELIKAFAGRPKPSRNAQLALLRFKSKISGEELSAEKEPSPLVELALSHFREYCARYYLFDDLRWTFEQFSPTDRIKFLQSAYEIVESRRPELRDEQNVSMDGITMETNYLKAEYFLDVSNPENDHASREGRFEAFVDKCIETYINSLWLSGQFLSTDNKPGDDVLVLAVMALMRLADTAQEEAKSKVYLLKAAALLDYFRSQSKHNYQGGLLAVRLYMLIGCTSMAMQRYSDMSIKQIQNDTLSHNIFTRISTIHPSTVMTGARIPNFNDPFLAMDRALGLYDMAQSDVPGLMRLALQEGSYWQIEGFMQFDQKLQPSISKYMLAMERRRISRLLSSQRHEEDEEILKEPNMSNPSDNRDFEVMASFEAPGQPRFEERFSVGPRPCAGWLRANMISEKLFTLLDSSNSIADPWTLIKDDPFAENAEAELTSFEAASLNIQWTLLKVLVTLKSGSGNNGPAKPDSPIARELGEIKQWLSEKLDKLRTSSTITALENLGINGNTNKAKLLLPDWTFFHESFTTLEAIKAIHSFVQSTSKSKALKAQVPKDLLQSIGVLVEQVFAEIRTRAINLRNSLTNSSALGALVEATFERPVSGDANATASDNNTQSFQSEFTESLHKIYKDQPRAESTLFGKVIESWIDALDGVLLIKLT
ncbi:hypothetical protein L228DRAFT_281666 [Xylona heveae TC161]|uniref:Uncharacterized protein n=1 Tax=Xylona heveae (strain CBS 132557 / TC161) TaxID=1328760 RepID=A0A165IA15_XYLHT|nr:hypothetical protein L228DRAFT_281666 [Xylona heveae TC161]KZF24609.1 hypothetical protein L228DRAFT_281666 [Xylona heveae TC161]